MLLHRKPNGVMYFYTEIAGLPSQPGGFFDIGWIYVFHHRTIDGSLLSQRSEPFSKCMRQTLPTAINDVLLRHVSTFPPANVLFSLSDGRSRSTAQTLRSRR